MNLINPPFPLYTDVDGSPLEDGYLFFGIANQNPETNPVAVYWDANGTIPAVQPIRTLDGYAVYNGSPSRLYVQGDFSVTVRNKNFSFVFNSPQVYGITDAVTTVSPMQYGAIGNGIVDDSAAVAAAFATGKLVDGQGLNYKVTPNAIIDPYATAGIGYGANKAWFQVGVCQNIGFVGDICFGQGAAAFLGKQQSCKKVTVTGDCRISSWYSDFQGFVVSGNTYLNGDLPPNINWVGCYYNQYRNCDFGNVIVDQRYGPFNLNNFTECQFGYFLVKDTGNTGYTPGFNPYKDFHMNTFIGCEWTEGILAPDGRTYSFVIDDSANVGGINRIIAPYQEMTNRGYYGRGFEIENIHNSGSVTGTYIGGPAGNERVGWQSPMSGEGAYIQRDVPHIYPAGQLALGGDWSILGSNGYPPCITWNSMTPSIVSDSQEPTGLGKAMQFVSTAGFASVYLDPQVNSVYKAALSFAIVYKPVSGEDPSFIVKDAGGGDIYGAANLIYLDNGWRMATGHTWGRVQIQSTNAYTVKIGAVSMGRGSGVVSPFSFQKADKPLLDLSGGSSFFKDFLNSSGLGVYNNAQLKTMINSGGNYDFYTIALANFSGESLNLRANFSLSSGAGGARYFYRESVIMIDGSGTLQETNLHNITGLNGSLSFVLSGANITVRATTSAAVNESGRMAISALGYNIGASKVTVL